MGRVGMTSESAPTNCWQFHYAILCWRKGIEERYWILSPDSSSRHMDCALSLQMKQAIRVISRKTWRNSNAPYIREVCGPGWSDRILMHCYAWRDQPSQEILAVITICTWSRYGERDFSYWSHFANSLTKVC